MKIATVAAMLLLVLSACSVIDTPCRRYLRGFTDAAQVCDISKMDEIAGWINAQDIIEQCSYEELRQFQRAADSCGLEID